MKKNLTVLQIIPGCIDDAENILKTKFLELSKFSSGVVVSTSISSGEFESGAYKITLLGLKNRPKFLVDILLFFTALREAQKISQSKGLNLIVCYDPMKTGLIGYILKLVFKAKLIVEINGVYDSSAIKEFMMEQSFLKRILFPPLQQFIIRKADALKCLYDGQLKSFSIPEQPIISTYFDYTDVEPIEYKKTDTKTILTVGFPAYIKGIDLLIEAFKNNAAKFPGWSLVIYGWFTNSELDSLALLTNSENNITINFPVPFSQISNVIDGCEIFVLASRTEAMGRVSLEAMARSKARIGARVDGIPTIISDNRDGLLFEACNVEDLQNKLIFLMESETERKRLSESGYNRFREEFTVLKYGNNVNKLYNKVANS